MRMPTDDPIEHTSFSGGGLRFAGFKRLPGRSFANILLEYGKRAIINMCAGGPDELYADCYDDIDPPQLDAVTPSSMVPAPARATQDYTRGAVVYSAYTRRIQSNENMCEFAKCCGGVVSTDTNKLTNAKFSAFPSPDPFNVIQTRGTTPVEATSRWLAAAHWNQK